MAVSFALGVAIHPKREETAVRPPRAGSTSTTGSCHCRGSSKTTPGWEYQLTAITGYLRTAWTAVAGVQRTTSATRTTQTVAQVKAVLRRLPASGAVPLFVLSQDSAVVTLHPYCPAHRSNG
jgi:hypothetical protein